ncbi:MAG TPA: Gfo/Idh/MocA family oxidoreductase [Solirubrobacterales bacterium]|nr:Gfo/Idh/MocA family oxidoreductase [Solirubrobacterales bacterium]
MSEQLRVGVVGCGRMGGFHVRNYAQIECADLVAVADPSAEARSRALAGAGAEEFSDWREMLESDELEAVSIACPSEHHADVAIEALAAGLHVLVEKPIATTLPDALRMRGAAIEADRKLMVGHVERFNPAVEKLRELVADGRLGRVYRAHTTRVGPLPTRIQDTGVAIDLATHDLDVMQYVLDSTIHEIYADGGRFQHSSQEDLLTCLARFGGEGGETLGLLDVNWLTPEKKREIALIGENGLLRASYITQDVWFVESTTAPLQWDGLSVLRGDGEGAAVRFSLAKAEPLRAELEAFCRCVLDDTPEPVGAHDGVKALAAALAVRESAAVRRPVELLDIPAPRPLEVLA